MVFNDIWSQNVHASSSFSENCYSGAFSHDQCLIAQSPFHNEANNLLCMMNSNDHHINFSMMQQSAIHCLLIQLAWHVVYGPPLPSRSCLFDWETATHCQVIGLLSLLKFFVTHFIFDY